MSDDIKDKLLLKEPYNLEYTPKEFSLKLKSDPFGALQRLVKSYDITHYMKAKNGKFVVSFPFFRDRYISKKCQSFFS